MFLLDDILLAPARGIMNVFKEIHKAAEQDQTSEAESIRLRLSELYMELETGRIDDAAFDSRERELLNRLDVLEGLEQPVRKDQGEEQSSTPVVLGKE